MSPERIVVVGAGMVAQRFVQTLRERDVDGRFHVTVIGEESYAPYDRVALTSFFSKANPEDLLLGDQRLWNDSGVTLVRDARVARIDRAARAVTTDAGESFPYDQLVLATGSSAWAPPLPGLDLPGVFMYRTLDDVAALQEWVRSRPGHGGPVRGAVIGGGLLGLEAAGALQSMGATSTVIEFADRLMALQVDRSGGEALKGLIERMGVQVKCSLATDAVLAGADGNVGSLRFNDGSEQLFDVVVFATGIRPRDELARDAGLALGERGGVKVDAACRTEDPRISAIGECAASEPDAFLSVGLIAPGNSMADVTVERLLGGSSQYNGADTATKLKLLGVDVASFGDAFAATPGALEVVYSDPFSGAYKKLVMTDDASVLLGGMFVGDASAYSQLRPMVGSALPGDPSSWILPEGVAERPELELPDEATVCSCNNITAGSVRHAVNEEGCHDLGAVKACTKAGTACGSCLPLVKKIMNTELEKGGFEVSNALCEHFAMSRSQLFSAIQVAGLTTFTDIIDRFGAGHGCDICKPTVGSILASIYNEHVLADGRAALQDTNDRVMANMQKDGTYSVVPRIPGGEITPDKLMVIAEVAQEFDLYTKITGGQRIDLFGARLEQLPAIWQRLVAAGMESGHAYGKSLRTVKSCVGSTWCRFGVQDSVGMAIALELRYRGLRSPHKMKIGVSGCARECAEARGKDVGVIATEKGWNVYVGGNGGFAPAHAQLLVEDVDDATVFQVIDRYLMLYIRTADRLQRTAPWQAEYEGGLDAIRDVIVNDSLGICDDLDAHMAHHVDSYEDEWKAVLDDPERLRQFQSFVNAPQEPDPSLAYVVERGQRRPATGSERESMLADAGRAL
ncbi:nitrite reductase large subunit NirB [Demequina sp. B12]|uniref:nitrite reductase large subunit NirB n=1 Tax=Demequina sp. B12 TaxID=2992757 RepID=UPI00237AE5CD|nr:nitrite reductase large subunit NirB [Demequina sp. B12]MDE0572824.1 nitrite reductase large subunit NirB [Demequina sp. B12]